MFLAISNITASANFENIDQSWIGSLETGVCLIATVNLPDIISMQKPKVNLELSVLKTDWTMDDIKTFWRFDNNNCMIDKTEHYVKKFIEFYEDLNAKRKAGKN